DVRRHAHGGAGEKARERGLARTFRIIGGSDKRRRGAVDNRRGIAAGLHPAEGWADGGERLDGRGAYMGVGGELLRAIELERAGREALPLECFVLDRRDLAGEEARTLRR